MRTLILLLMLIFAINCFAAGSLKEARPVQAMVAVGTEFRPEKDVQGNMNTHNLTNYALGAGYKSWLVVLEKATFEEASGNLTLNLKRTLDDMMLWGHYRMMSWNYLVPYLGLGAGFYKDKVETTLLGTTTTNESKNKFLTGGNFGISLDIPYVWLSMEARILFGDELDRQPTIGGLVRVGAYF
jgi:hypothetical protein